MAPGDAIRVEVRTSPVVTDGTVDVASTRPFVLFNFLERYLRREGFGTRFMFNSPGDGEEMYELDEGQLAGEDAGTPAGSGMRLMQVSNVEQWVNVCFGADREGREWAPAAPEQRVPLSDALRLFGHPAVALFLLGTHYSQPLGDAYTGLTTGSRHAGRIREVAATLLPGRPSPRAMIGRVEEFHAALADDLDTPTAFVAMFEWVLEAERRGGGVGDRDLRTMLAMFELDELARPLE